MNLNFLGRVSRLAAIGAILLGSASCVKVDATLGENFIPTDQIWNVFTPEAVVLEDVMLHTSDSLSAYSTSRFTFGAITDGQGTSIKSTSFTLVPFADTIDFGKNPKVKRFHFTAAKDTISTYNDIQGKMLQNVYVTALKQPLDSNILFIGDFSGEKGAKNREAYLTDQLITSGIPIYNGGDSLSFEFSREFTEELIRKLDGMVLDSLDTYLKAFPGIYITTDTPSGLGGRINMFELGISTDSYNYIQGNYAELQYTAEYDYSDEPVDTSLIFYFGPGEIMEPGADDFPSQFAFNASDNAESLEKYGKGVKATDKIYIEGGIGAKPVVKATEIKAIVEKLVADAGISDISEVVINKATIILPYNVGGDFDALDKYPDVLSPTVKLKSSDGKYVSFAGLTDSSIETENQGNINRSLNMYCPDISHHVQEILKLKKKDG